MKCDDANHAAEVHRILLLGQVYHVISMVHILSPQSDHPVTLNQDIWVGPVGDGCLGVVGDVFVLTRQGGWGVLGSAVFRHG